MQSRPADLDSLMDQVLASLPRKGRPGKNPPSFGRELSIEDLGRLRDKAAPATVTPLAKVRSPHHFAARLIASGEKIVDVAAATGYTPARLQQLSADPMFQELVSHYKAQVEGKFMDVVERLKNLGLHSIEELQDRLDESPESFSPAELRQLAGFAFDRAGYGPSATVKTENSQTLTVELVDRIKSELASRGRVRQVSDLELEALPPPESGT